MQDGPRTDWSTDMQRYRFVQNYRSGVGAWSAGDEYDFDPEMAAYILRDSPGCMEVVPGKLVFVPEDDDGEGEETEESEETEELEDAAETPTDGPPHNRQVTTARKRGS